MKRDIAVVGTKDFTIGFELTGAVDAVRADSIEEELNKMARSPKHDIVIIREKDFQNLAEVTKQKVESSTEPVFVRLSEEPQIENLNSKIEKAIGADISD